MTKQPQTFEEFWPYYVSQHKNPTSRRLHFVGTSIAMGCVAISPLNPSALLLAPVAGYGMAWIGHFVFEKNRPATFGSAKFAAWSLRGDFKMWMHMLEGTMDAELAAVEAAEAAELATADVRTPLAAV